MDCANVAFMRAMSYNILTGGRDGLDASRLELIRDVVRAENVDILALQECNLFEAEHQTTFHWFERELGMRGLIARATSGFNVCLYVREFPVLRSVEVNQWCQHAMLQATVAVGSQELEVFCVHHNPFSGTSRLSETEWLAGWSRPERLQLIMGDFNANSRVDRAHVDLESLPARYRVRQSLRQVTPPTLDTRSIDAMLEAEYVDLLSHFQTEWTPTVPTGLVGDKNRFPMRIDFIFASQSLAEKAQDARTVQGAIAEQASDHYPVVADFYL